MQRQSFLHAIISPLLLCAVLVTQASAQAPRPSRVDAFEDGRFKLDDQARAVDGQRVEAPLPARPIRLAILPDRTTGRAWGMPYLLGAVEDLKRASPDAIFTVGDMVQGYTRDDARYEREVDEYLHAIRPIADRFYPTPGNHDVISGDRDPSDDRFVDRYRARFGPLHYTVKIGGVTVIVLFSDESMGDGSITFSDEQLTWLTEELQQASEGPIVLLMHRPLWRYNQVNWKERVQPLLAEHQVDAVIAGHYHAMQKDDTLDGVAYHILGTCGGMIDQHPLSGQLQHVSMLHIDPEGDWGTRTSLHHQIAGTTLPDDFVVRQDQDRVYALKTNPSVVTIHDSIPDTSTGRFEVPLEIELHNPLDIPVVFSIEPSSGPGAWTIEDDATWQSLTDQDTFNPHTMHGRGRSMIQISEKALLAPGERRTLEAAVISRAPRGGRPGLPPQLDITASFRDTKGRLVPVKIRRRLHLERRPITLVPGGEPVLLPISAWRFSVYDTVEEDPECLLSLDDAGRLTIEVFAAGDLLVGAGPDKRPLAERLKNPMADALLIEVGPVEQPPREVIYWEVKDARAIRLLPDGTEQPIKDAEVVSDAGGWRARITLEEKLPPTESIRIGVSDNDRTYHTQWRNLTPPGQALTIERGRQEPPMLP